MPMPLSKLPKTFNFVGGKGFSPHLSNAATNENYVGNMPAIEFYNPDEMHPDVRQEFLKWYTDETARGAVFNMSEEIVKYCISDVDILRRACLSFWSRFLHQNSVDPFRESCTIAGACNNVFRNRFLKDNTIGIIPRGGYKMADIHLAHAMLSLVDEQTW